MTLVISSYILHAACIVFIRDDLFRVSLCLLISLIASPIIPSWSSQQSWFKVTREREREMGILIHTAFKKTKEEAHDEASSVTPYFHSSSLTRLFAQNYINDSLSLVSLEATQTMHTKCILSTKSVFYRSCKQCRSLFNRVSVIFGFCFAIAVTRDTGRQVQRMKQALVWQRMFGQNVTLSALISHRKKDEAETFKEGWETIGKTT